MKPTIPYDEIKTLYEEGHVQKSFFMNRYNVSERTIRRAFIKLGLVHKSDFDLHLESVWDDLIADYKNGEKIIDVCLKYNLHVKVVRPRLKELGIYRNEQPRHEADFSYFESIDSEQKAYWLGFLYADGCLTGCSLKFGLNKDDVDTVKQFCEDIGSTYPIHNEGTICRVTMTNRKLSKDLIKQGVVHQKTFSLKFPTKDIVPKHLLNHFIRGYFDGDGCVTHQCNGTQCSIGFAGLDSFLIELQKVLVEECDLNMVKMHSRRISSPEFKQFSYRGNKQCKRIYDYLYKNATRWMPRKREKMESILGVTK